MSTRVRPALLALGLAATLLTGCATSGADRNAGDAVTEREAQTLAGVLLNNYRAGGADFVVTAAFGESALLTLTGAIDFRQSVGRAQAVTSAGDGGTGDARTLYFTPHDIWFGDVPGLAGTLSAAGLPNAAFVRRPVAAPADGPQLVDVLVQVLLHLSSPSADNPRSFLHTGYRWQGQRSVDGRLTTVFRLHAGRTVAVGASDGLLVQYETPLQGGAVEVTVTFTDHGPRSIDLPADETTVTVTDRPELADLLGV